MITKKQLIDEVAHKTDLTKKDVTEVLNAFMDTVKEQLQAGEKVALTGFGTFEVRERAAREGRNPQTGATIQIAASKTPAFKAGKELKEAVNA
ncbi:MAG: HU family DNA-binding protein [Culicoidibacterales bacterium]